MYSDILIPFDLLYRPYYDPINCKNTIVEIGYPHENCYGHYSYNLTCNGRPISLPSYMYRGYKVIPNGNNRSTHKCDIEFNEYGLEFINRIINECSIMLKLKKSCQPIPYFYCPSNFTLEEMDRICITLIYSSPNGLEVIFGKRNMGHTIYDLYKYLYKLNIFPDIKFNIFKYLLLVL